MTPSWDAVVLAGGRGRRLGGVDKAAVTVGGHSLLDRVLRALAAVEPAVGRVVLVGPARPGLDREGILVTREDPPGGGPVAGIAAGLVEVRAPLVAVLAVDMPFLDRMRLAELRAAVAGQPAEVALLVDPDGREQTLAAVWRTSSLRASLPPQPAGAAVRGLFAGRVVARVRADALSCLDCDAAPDVDEARAAAERFGR